MQEGVRGLFDQKWENGRSCPFRVYAREGRVMLNLSLEVLSACHVVDRRNQNRKASHGGMFPLGVPPGAPLW